MALVAVKNYCPCCGYPGLDVPAYRQLGPPPWLDHGPPPYVLRYGDPSYDVCDCCGFEFGNDDEPGTSCKPVSFEEYRQKWVASGCQWFDTSKRPTAWDAQEQFSAIGIRGQSA